MGLRSDFRAVLSALAAATALGVVCAGPAQSQQSAVGLPFSINTYATNNQLRPFVDRAASGEFIVSWTSGFQFSPGDSEDGSDNGVFARRFEQSGAPLTGAFQVNSYTPGDQDVSAIRINAAGNALIVWQSRDQDGDDSGLFGQLYDAAMTPIGSEFAVNTHTMGRQSVESITFANDESFLVVWQSGSSSFGDGLDGDASGISGRRFSGATGTPLGPEFVINSYTTGSQFAPAITRAADGFVVVWVDSGRGPMTIQARRLDASGAPEGSDFQVSDDDSGTRAEPSVVGNLAGEFVAVWTDQNGFDGESSGIFARAFSALDSPASGDVQVNTYTTGFQSAPSALRNNDGTFTVAWKRFLATGERASARNIDSTGTPINAEYELAPDTDDAVFDLTLAPDADGGFVAVYQTESDFDFDRDIEAQRFACTAPGPDADSDGLSDDCDPCPSVPASIDADADCIQDASDNCPESPNPSQADADFDSVGDQCDLCPGEDDTINVDSDAERDCIDLCVRAPGASTFLENSKIRYKFVNTNNTFGDDRVFVSAQGILPATLPFSEIDPTSQAVRFRSTHFDGFQVVDRVLQPQAFDGTAGWVVSGTGNRWKFRDKNRPADQGIVQVTIQDRSKRAPGQIKVKIKSRNGSYDTPNDSVPLQASILIGDGSVGECIESTFVLDDCRFTALDSTVSCRN